MQTYKTEYWLLNVPALWDAEADGDTDVIYDNDGVGELVVSTLYQGEGIADEQLEAMASEHVDSDADIEDVVLGDFSGIAVSFEQDGEYWCEWYLRSEKVLLFITYNCDAKNVEVDEDVVESILESLEEVV